jgi:hypothetical protein
VSLASPGEVVGPDWASQSSPASATMPTVRITRPSRYFWAAKRCSTRDLTQRVIARSSASNLTNSRSDAPARAKCSRYSQIVLASGGRVVQCQTDKPHKACTALKHQHFEDQHRIIGRPAAPDPIRARQRCFQIASKHFEIDDLRQPLQRITSRPTMPSAAHRRKNRLPRHCRSPSSPDPRSPLRAEMPVVFRAVQKHLSLIRSKISLMR